MMSAPRITGSGVDAKYAYVTVTYATVGCASTWANFPPHVANVTPAASVVTASCVPWLIRYVGNQRTAAEFTVRD